MPASSSVAETWARLERWLAANGPRARASLNPPVTAEEIAEAERQLGLSFPEELRASLCRHDGQDADVPLFGSWSLFPCRRIVSEWWVWKELFDRGRFQGREAQPEGPVRAEWWDPRWIPVTGDGSGDHHCLDLAPAPGGAPGQVIAVWHDSGRRRVLAVGFHAWLHQIADDLEAGRERPLSD